MTEYIVNTLVFYCTFVCVLVFYLFLCFCFVSFCFLFCCCCFFLLVFVFFACFVFCIVFVFYLFFYVCLFPFPLRNLYFMMCFWTWPSFVSAISIWFCFRVASYLLKPSETGSLKIHDFRSENCSFFKNFQTA